jgi:hypothetical protein
MALNWETAPIKTENVTILVYVTSGGVDILKELYSMEFTRHCFDRVDSINSSNVEGLAPRFQNDYDSLRIYINNPPVG